MSEQGPQLPSSAELLGVEATEFAEQLRREGVYEFEVAREQRQDTDEETCREELDYRIEAVLALAGIPAQKWAEHFRGGLASKQQQDIAARAAHQAAHSRLGAGHWLYDLTMEEVNYRSLPIGEADVALLLESPTGWLVKLSGQGHYWTDHGIRDQRWLRLEFQARILDGRQYNRTDEA